MADNEHLTRAKELRYKWIEKIPKNEVHAVRYKVTVAWFEQILYLFDEFTENNPNLKEDYHKFQEYLDSTNFEKRLTIPEDIEQGNKLLELLIKELEQ